MSLATTYLGLPLINPLVASASPLNANLDNLRRLEDAGAAAIVLPSLFQEQVEQEQAENDARQLAYADSSPEAMTYFPPAASGPYGLVPERYLDLVRRGAQAVAIPVIASLNGSSKAGWIDYAALVEQAGAGAIELNMYHVPADLLESGRDIEARYSEIVGAVCRSVEVPVSVKLTPYLSAIGHFANTLVEQGAGGLVLFNRLLEPDIDLATLHLTNRLALSTPEELRLPLLWTAIMAGRTSASLATSGGVGGPDEVIKCILAGADAVMTTSALLRHGIGSMAKLLNGLRNWMADREIADLAAMRGMMSWQRSTDRSVYTRANYLRILERYAAA
ncbi:MAG: dihydroorotate dehydrogenase-like protein [Janthinobacterium lividum]